MIAEDRNEALPSYLDLRFPASDIPAQARELYRLNRLRLIPDAELRARAARAGRATRDRPPLDLSFAVAAQRLARPPRVHAQHGHGRVDVDLDPARRRAVGADLLPQQGRRGACRSQVRTACDFLGQILSLQLAAKEHALETGRRMELKRVESRLLARMAAAERFTDGLADQPEDLLRLADARGAAILHEGRCTPRRRRRPPRTTSRRIADWLERQRRHETFRTESLARDIAGAEACKDTASGLLAISISKIHPSYVLWFRPEVVRTVSWGGDPRKPVEPAASGPRLHPRTSFEQWKETVRLRVAALAAERGRGGARAAERHRRHRAAAGRGAGRRSATSSGAATRSSRRSPTRSRTTCARRSGTSSATPSCCASTRASGSTERGAAASSPPSSSPPSRPASWSTTC